MLLAYHSDNRPNWVANTCTKPRFTAQLMRGNPSEGEGGQLVERKVNARKGSVFRAVRPTES